MSRPLSPGSPLRRRVVERKFAVRVRVCPRPSTHRCNEGPALIEVWDGDEEGLLVGKLANDIMFDPHPPHDRYKQGLQRQP